MRAGLKGELRVLQFIEEFAFPKETLIIHNYQSRVHSKWSIQIDFLILTKKGILIIEVKNIAGHIKFQRNPPQIIRTLPDGTENGMDCPFVQMERNSKAIQQILQNYSSVNTQTCLVWANRKARLSIEGIPKPHSFIPVKSLQFYFESYFKQHDIFSNESFKMLQGQLLAKNKVPTKSLCQQYQVAEKDLLKGMFCNKCFQSLRKQRRTWDCPICVIDANDQAEKNLMCQFSLVSSPLRIGVLQENLQHLSRKQIRLILQKNSVKSKGIKRGVLYSLE
ncbi:nuclease-related domain-containing protein [Tetzosporium hominis]|uniref:nuclease-related domain-containing protein n=1 Tax=Tetzosporium hominis TaxID=2020506 RepID=UPI002434C165|nr:nuclease-related domain-containing protein [Tetzosporium hominis]